MWYILAVENVVLQIAMGTTNPQIKWEYLSYEKDLEKREPWFRNILRNNIPNTANPAEWGQH